MDKFYKPGFIAFLVYIGGLVAIQEGLYMAIAVALFAALTIGLWEEENRGLIRRLEQDKKRLEKESE